MFRQSAKEDQKYIYQFRLLLVFFLTISLSITHSGVLAQAVYYVAATGSDSNNGTTAGTPFQSLAKVNSLALVPGSQVLFRRGDTFRGTLTVRQSGSAGSPIVFDAYGSGQKPVISGSVPITNWSNLGNNTWQADCPSCGNAVTGVYKNGTALPLGRYPNADGPNKGNLTIYAHTEKYQIFSLENLPAGVNWKGAEVVMRPVAWIIDRAVVDAQYGNALNLFNNSSYYPRDNSEFFFQNHPATLDKNGEWCYNLSTKKITVYSDSGTPSSELYTATVYGKGIDVTNVSHITLRNLQVTETLQTSVNGYNSSNLTMTNLDVTNSGEDGVIILGSGNNILLEDTKILVANNNGVWIDPYPNTTIRRNTIRKIGVLAGRGKSGDGQYNGITSMGSQNVLIEHNVLDGVGYNGITFRNNTTIRQNVIANYCAIKIDGGGIYAHNGNKNSMTNIHILSNILYTDAAGASPWVDYSIGIFLDDCVENVDIRGNTIFGNTQWGVFLHGANTVTFTDNTLFDNRTCQLVLYHNGGACPIRGDIIKRNIIVSKASSQMVAQVESNANDLLLYGTIDSNYYARPFNEEAVIRGVINTGQGGNFSLAGWKNFSGQDLHSQSGPLTYPERKNEGAGGTNLVRSNFDQDINGWEMLYSRYGNAVVAHDNTNKLDGGSVRFSFPVPSGQNGSFAQMVKRVGAFKKGVTYVLRFDAVASTNVPLLVHLREYGHPFYDYGRRYTLTISPTRTSYELVFTAQDDEPDGIIMMQAETEGPIIWVDNVRLQENVPIVNNPDDLMKLYYNPTLRDSTVVLPSGIHRDVKNQAYTSSLILKPYTSIILFKEPAAVSAAPADLSLSLYSDKRLVQVNEPTTFRLRVRNESDIPAALARWTYRLPANSEFVMTPDPIYSDNVLTGTVSQLAPHADTTFTFTVRPTAAGVFRTSAQLTTSMSPDPDSNPSSGTSDGEDDTSTTELRVGDTDGPVFESPNPNARSLPAVTSNQPAPDLDQADLSLRMEVSQRVPAVGDLITCTLYITNAGGLTATGVQIQDQLPNGLQLVDATDWTVAGQTISRTIAPIPAGITVPVSFQLRVVTSGVWVNQAQINASAISDPDSTPGNGFTNGEDDQARTDIRVR